MLRLLLLGYAVSFTTSLGKHLGQGKPLGASLSRCRVIPPQDFWGQPTSRNISGSCVIAADSGLTFLAYSSEFYKLFPGQQFPNVARPFLERDYEFAHEGPVYLAASNEIFFVSNRFCGNSTTPACSDDLSNQSVRMYTLGLDDPASLRRVNSSVAMANGATIDCTDGRVLVTSQGFGRDKYTDIFMPSSLYSLDPATGLHTAVVNNAFGLPFNSLNGVAQGPDGTLWFTDPEYGRQQGFRAANKLLPNAVWALSPDDPAPRMVDMHMSRPNGIALSPDGKTLYVTDTGMILGDGDARAVYAYDIVGTETGSPTLSHQRLLYNAGSGIPDGIKVDIAGNLYIGQGDGVAVVSAYGAVLGRILTPPSAQGVTELVFGGEDYKTLVLLGGKAIWKVDMAIEGALRCERGGEQQLV